jgi:hypothetical protein
MNNNIDKLTDSTEKLIEKIRDLKHKYKFHSNDNEVDALDILNDVAAGLENWLEIAVEDSNSFEEEDGDEEENE